MRLDRRSLLAGLAAGIASPAWGRTPPGAMERLFLEGRYLPRYLELQAAAAAGQPMADSLLAQYAALVGDERAALALERSDGGPLPDLSAATAQDAIEAITERARDAQIVILNEAHHISGHRGFAAAVLRALRPLGFDTFAAETFLSQRTDYLPSITDFRPGAPFLGMYGYYSRDPVFAEAVREAASLGYRFESYEMRDDQDAGPDADMRTRVRVREEAQARNFMENVLGARPDARVFVLVGYGHAAESDGQVLMFAAHLKRMSGIDPLTIEQSTNWPALDPAADAPHVAAVLQRFRPEAPVSIWLDGEMFAAPDFVGRLDMSVFHPRRPAVAGRPGWLASDSQRRRVDVEVPSFEGPALIQATHVLEGPAGVPADQFPLEAGQRQASFFLRPGSYFVRLETAEGFSPAWDRISVEA